MGIQHSHGGNVFSPRIIAHNVTSPLGMTTRENYLAVKGGRSALQCYDGLPPQLPGRGRPLPLPEPFCASLFTARQWQTMAIGGLTRFESLAVHSAREALWQCPMLDVTAGNVVFILSTTKANVELLSSPCCHAQGPLPAAQASTACPSVAPGAAALRIARELGITTTPVVVCNACISGVAAVILAKRLLESGCYDYAVVCGADVQSRFTVSGFLSLKAVSASHCRPFDMERTGLNLGEAAATMVLAGGQPGGCQPVVAAGAIRNDAYHISSPSKDGEGARLALQAALTPAASVQPSSLAFINAHGTATMFNDQMESVAIERAGLGSIAVNGLKGYYGHTLGAAGILETVVSLAALSDATILATRGFAERGVSGKINIASANTAIAESATSFVKMISGFGGGNAAIVAGLATPSSAKALRAGSTPCAREAGEAALPRGVVAEAARVTLTPTAATVCGRPLPAPHCLADLYKRYVADYPRFYKMDPLCRLGFIASELLLQAEAKSPALTTQSPAPHVSRAVVLFNSSSSVAADRAFMATIAPGNYFPSPSHFVYTLPNIVTGEIAMRNGYHGETSFFILPWRDDALVRHIALSTLQDREVTSILTGWIDYYDETHYEADLMLLTT